VRPGAAGTPATWKGKTVEPERGDYYLTPDGEMAQAPGRWLADEETLARLGVTAGEPVDGSDFIALMEGRHPGTGRWLRREGAGGGRGGGIDVTFSAPKSVSTVWALGDPWQREQIEAAHARAVESAVRYLREQVPVVRRRYGGSAPRSRTTADICAVISCLSSASGRSTRSSQPRWCSTSSASATTACPQRPSRTT
jgi:conjugative relaxase-like TrwC/TraI family protein